MRRRVVPPLNIFLDDGGVITDKQRRAAEFGRLVGDYFVPLLGGTEEAWARAHHTVVDRLADPQSMGVLTTADFVSFYRAYQLHWVAGMCELLDLPTPPEEERLDLAYRARLDHAPHPGSFTGRSRSHPSLASSGVRAAHGFRVVLTGTGRVL